MKTIATVGGLGYSRVGPGTLGSAVGLGLAWILSSDPRGQMIGCFVAILLGFWSAGPTARLLGKEDPEAVIIDEVAGMMVAVALLPVRWPVYLSSFLLFRFLDIRKPLLINQIQKLPGSWGIMLDDLAAGLLTNLVCQLVVKRFL